MKKIFTAITLVAVFAACNNRTKTTEETRLGMRDTTGLKEFQLQKEQRRIQEQLNTIQTQGVNDPNALNPNNLYPNNVNQPGTVTYTTAGESVVMSRPAPTRTYRTASTRTTRSRSSNRGYSSRGNGGYASAPAPAPAKKGWSKAAKGAVIGGGSGAVLGAILDKKHGRGAVIGGILGAAGGYAIGRGKDKRDGRY